MKDYPKTTERGYLLMEDLAPDDRPREKALTNGIRSLSNAELIAIIFGNGIRGKSVLTMSRELLARCNGRLSTIAGKSIKEVIKENPGIGPAKAIALSAALELGARSQAEVPEERPKIQMSADVYNYMRPKLQWLNHEEFWIVLLSRSSHVIGSICLSQGGSSATVVDAKILFRKVLEYGENVSAVILVHNHPSGNPNPSGFDDSLTDKIKSAGKLLDITVPDHVIVARTQFYSYADNGRI